MKSCKGNNRGTLGAYLRMINSRSQEIYIFPEGLWHLKRDVEEKRLLIPEMPRGTELGLEHDAPWAGHPGRRRTISRIRGLYYWPQLVRDVIKYVKSCQMCAERKTPMQLTAPLGQPNEAKRPFEQVSLDIVGPLPTTNSGDKYLLTFVDHFSRYAEAVPLQEQTAEAIARVFVEHIVLKHSAPQRLPTDQGRNFTSDLFVAACQLLWISKLQTTAYQPECNGMVERFHRTLVESITHYIKRDGKDWDMWLPYVVRSLVPPQGILLIICYLGEKCRIP